MAYKLIHYYCCDRKGNKVFLPSNVSNEVRQMNIERAKCILGCSSCIFRCSPVVRIAVIKPDPVLEEE